MGRYYNLRSDFAGSIVGSVVSIRRLVLRYRRLQLAVFELTHPGGFGAPVGLGGVRVVEAMPPDAPEAFQVYSSDGEIHIEAVYRAVVTVHTEASHLVIPDTLIIVGFKERRHVIFERPAVESPGIHKQRYTRRALDISCPPKVLSGSRVALHSRWRVMGVAIYAIASVLNISEPCPVIYAPGSKGHPASLGGGLCGGWAECEVEIIAVAGLEGVVPLHKGFISIYRGPAEVEGVVPVVEIHLEAEPPLLEV